LLVVLVATATEAQTIRKVPADFPTIQAAINASSNGDTVRVAPGIYVENIIFNGKAITVVSEAGVNVTTIDGNQAGAVARFITSEGSNSILEGFTLRNGRNTSSDGAGIRISGSSPTVRATAS
jgi:pectin methylesterase-like acyl-CoA thioesterase